MNNGASEPWRGQRGQSMVETALFFTALLALLVGVFQVAIAINAYLQVINAAREGARYAMRTFDFTDVATSAQNTWTQTEAAAAPLPLSATNAAIIVTSIQTSTTSGAVCSSTTTTLYVSSYNSAYDTNLSTSSADYPTQFTCQIVADRSGSSGYSVPSGDDELVIVEFYYYYPLFVWNANVPMYSYVIMPVVGQ